jgi:hypothetical protein
MHFESIDPSELTFEVRNAGVVESEINGKEYQKLYMMLMHGEEMIFGTFEMFPMHQAEYIAEQGGPLSFLIDDLWFAFEASGAQYDLNFWYDSEDKPHASIYPIYEDVNGDNDTDCSELIHTITNFKIDLD